MINKKNKSHLFYKNDILNIKDWATGWKVVRWFNDNKNKKQNEEKKDYSIQRKNLKISYIKNKRKFESRYSSESIKKRINNNLPCKVYLKMITLKEIDDNTPFLNNFNFKLISYNKALKEWIFVIWCDKINYFFQIMKNFITNKEDILKWDLKLISLINNFEIIDSKDRSLWYCNYLNWEELTFYLYKDVNSLNFINSLKNKFKNFEIINAEDINNNNEYTKILITNNFLDSEKDIEELVNLYDEIKTLYTSCYNMKISPNGQKIKFEETGININSETENTVCIVDTWINNQNKLISNLVNNSPDINFQYIWASPFEDKADNGYHWHWTPVATVAIFWKQITDWNSLITPVSKVCSLKVIDWKNSTNIKNIIEWIKKIYLSSWEKINLFNLSINTDVPLEDNEISIFAYELDKLMHKYNLICIVSTWNITNPISPYPNSWKNSDSNIATPAENINWITIWSICSNCKWEKYISEFSRKDNLLIKKIKNRDENISYRNPNLVLFWWDLNKNEVKTVSAVWDMIKVSWTSFSAPYWTFLLSKIKKEYPNLKKDSLKALLINRSKIIDKEELTEFYTKNNWILLKSLYWNWTINTKDESKLIYSTDDSVTIVIESSIDYSNYRKWGKSYHPFVTTTFNLPKFIKKDNLRRKNLEITATLCYSPLPTNPQKHPTSEYNPCYIWFNLHCWDDNFSKSIENNDWTSALSKLNNQNIKWLKWSDTDFLSTCWNNCQTLSLKITKNKYNSLVEKWLQITIKSRLSEIAEIVEYYKKNPQNFSLVINIQDLNWEWILYDEIKSRNNILDINTATAKLKTKA